MKSIILLSFLFFINYSINAQEKPPGNDTLIPPDTTVDSGKDKITSKEKKSPFSLSFGYNFDFLDGIKTNELYADVRVDLPNLLRKNDKQETKTFLDRIGIEVGAYQLRAVSRLDTLNEQFRLVDGVLISPDSFQLLYITANSNSIRKTIRENLGVYLQPKLDLMTTKQTRFNVLLHCEWLRSVLEHSFERNALKDTTLFVPSDWPRPYDTVNEVPKTEKSNGYEYNIYIGAGFDLQVSLSDADFYLKVICGHNGAKLVREEENISIISKTKGMFYLAKFELLETQVSGIKLGVEVRGLFTNSNASPTLDRALPYFGIYLAKQFTFKKVGELIEP